MRPRWRCATTLPIPRLPRLTAWARACRLLPPCRLYCVLSLDPQWQIGKICGTDNDQPELAELCIASAPAPAPAPTRTATGRRCRLSRFELKWILLLLLLHVLLLLLLLLLTCSQWANLPYAGKMANCFGCCIRNSSQVSGCPTLPCQDSLCDTLTMREKTQLLHLYK